MLGLGSSSPAAALLQRLENGVFLPNSRWTHPARVAVVAFEATVLESISMNAATARATWRHLSSSPVVSQKIKFEKLPKRNDFVSCSSSGMCHLSWVWKPIKRTKQKYYVLWNLKEYAANKFVEYRCRCFKQTLSLFKSIDVSSRTSNTGSKFSWHVMKIYFFRFLFREKHFKFFTKKMIIGLISIITGRL